MKITIELPDSTALAFVNYAFIQSGTMFLGCKSIDSNDLKNGYVKVGEEAQND